MGNSPHYRLKISTPCHTQPHTVSFCFSSSPYSSFLSRRRTVTGTDPIPQLKTERTTTAPTVECLAEYLCLFGMYGYVVRLLAPLPPDAVIHCQCTRRICKETLERLSLTSPSSTAKRKSIACRCHVTSGHTKTKINAPPPPDCETVGGGWLTGGFE